MSYVAQGTFNDAMLVGTDKDAMAAIKNSWNKSTTQADKDYWHQKAENIREKYAYSGVGDGSMYKPLTDLITPVFTPTGTTTTPTGTTTGTTQTPVTDEFFSTPVTGVEQVSNALNDLNIDKLVSVGAGFFFMSIIASIFKRK
jgi:hypothetical protein